MKLLNILSENVFRNGIIKYLMDDRNYSEEDAIDEYDSLEIGRAHV